MNQLTYQNVKRLWELLTDTNESILSAPSKNWTTLRQSMMNWKQNFQWMS